MDNTFDINGNFEFECAIPEQWKHKNIAEYTVHLIKSWAEYARS